MFRMYPAIAIDDFEWRWAGYVTVYRYFANSNKFTDNAYIISSFCKGESIWVVVAGKTESGGNCIVIKE